MITISPKAIASSLPPTTTKHNDAAGRAVRTAYARSTRSFLATTRAAWASAAAPRQPGGPAKWTLSKRLTFKPVGYARRPVCETATHLRGVKPI